MAAPATQEAPAVAVARVPPPPPIAFANVLAWAKAGGHSLRFRMGSDHFQVSADGLSVELAPGKWVSTNPRLALPMVGDLPVIRAEDLAPLFSLESPHDPAATRAAWHPFSPHRPSGTRQPATDLAAGPAALAGQPSALAAMPDSTLAAESTTPPLSAVFTVDMGPPASWDAVASSIPSGAEPLLGDAGILIRLGVLSPETASEALDQARNGEPLDLALARLGLVKLDTWLEALVGREWLHAPASRPFKDRIGMRLLASHAISQGQLKQALESQAAAGPHRLLGQVLGVPEPVLQKALVGHDPLPVHFPEADTLGEILIRWGCVSRADWLTAVRSGADAVGMLMKAGKLLPGHVARARAYREALGRHLAARRIRLGQILVDRGLDRQVLGKALAWQVDQPLPLAELMVLHRLLGPAEAARALGQQAAAYRALAESGLPPLEPRRPPVQVSTTRPAGRTPPLRQPFPRQAYALAVVGIFALSYAFAYGARQRGFDYGWFNLFFPTPVPTAPLYRPPGGEVHDVSESRRLARPVAVQPVERLDLPLGRGMPARPGATSDFAPMQSPAELGGRGPEGGPTAIAALEIEGTRPAMSPGPPFQGLLPFAHPSSLAGGPVPTLAPPRRSIAAPPADREPVESLAPPDFPAWSRPTLSVTTGGPYSYPMEKPLALATPPSAAPLAARSSRPGESRADDDPGEPAVMRRFRADLARLRAAEALHRQRGRDYRQGGQEDAARRELALAENVRRSQAVFRARIGESYYREGNLVAAAAELRGALHDDPGFALPRYYLAVIARAQGKHAEAIAQFRQYLELAPDGEFAPEARKALIDYGEKLPARAIP